VGRMATCLEEGGIESERNGGLGLVESGEWRRARGARLSGSGGTWPPEQIQTVLFLHFSKTTAKISEQYTVG
jgi:hypothetical protein